MSRCYKDGCGTLGTKEQPLVAVAERLGASYGGYTVYGCKAHADSYRPPLLPGPIGRGAN